MSDTDKVSEEEIGRAVDAALIGVPHPHPHGGHPEQCWRCDAREKLVKLIGSVKRPPTTCTCDPSKAEGCSACPEREQEAETKAYV